MTKAELRDLLAKTEAKRAYHLCLMTRNVNGLSLEDRVDLDLETRLALNDLVSLQREYEHALDRYTAEQALDTSGTPF